MSATPSPARVAHRGRRRATVGRAAAAASVLALTAGCGGESAEQFYEDALSFGFPDPVTDRAESVFDLWLGSTAAALVVGAFVAALILFACFRYRKTSDELPRQVRYNLPVEVLYTVIPFVIIAVLFYYTVVSQNTVNDLSEEAEGGVDVNVTVVGFQWNWQFQYPDAGVQVTGSPDQNALPQLVLPVGQKVRVVEESPDVIHSFYVPSFLFKRDVIPGRQNTFEFTIEKEGEYEGRCAEFCGERHYAMNFSVLAVSPEEYESYIAALQDDPDAEILTPGAPAPGTEAQEQEEEQESSS